MKKIGLVLGLVCMVLALVPVAAKGGDYTVTLTAGQESLLTWALAQENARLVSQGQGTITRAQLVRLAVMKDVGEWTAAWKDANRVTLKDAYETADPAVQDQVKALLGMP